MGSIRNFVNQAKGFDFSFIDPSKVGKGLTLGLILSALGYVIMKDKTVEEIKDILDDIVGIVGYDYMADIGGQQMSMVMSTLSVVFGAGNTIADMIIDTEDDGTGTLSVTSQGWMRILGSLVVMSVLVVAGVQRSETKIGGLLA